MFCARLHAPQSPLQTLLQRCYPLVISSLLDLVSRDVPTGYFVSSGGYPMFLCSPCAPKSPQSAYPMLVAICELRVSTNSWTLEGAYIGFCNVVDSYFLTKSFLELKVSELQMVAMSVLNLSSLGILNCDRLASGRRKCYYIIIF